MVATIIDAGGGARNDSEYLLSQSKWKVRPHWLEEVEGYRDRCTHTDDEVVRTYKCPWSQRFRAREWLLGYSYTEVVHHLLSPAVTPTLRRVIPAQDPERPWLFCSTAEVMQGKGAWVEAPDSYVTDVDGNILDDPADPTRPWRTGAMAYVDNALGGTAGSKEVNAGNAAAGNPIAQAVGNVLAARPELPPSQIFKDGAAWLRATYRPRDYSVLTDEGLEAAGGFEMRRYLERHQDYGLEAIPLARLAAAGALLNFATGPFGPRAGHPNGDTIPEAGVRQNPIATLHYTWHEVPDPPFAAFANCLGKINDNIFDGYGGAPKYSSGTLLCLPWKLERKTGPTGRITWKIQLRFSYRPQGWNFFPAADGNFYLATWGGTIPGDMVYPSADFESLFRVPVPTRYLS